MFSYVDLEERISAGHRLRKIQEFVNAALAALDAAFATLYSADGRPSIAPERLLRAALIQACPRLRACEKIEARCLPVCFTRPGANQGGDEGVMAGKARIIEAGRSQLSWDLVDLEAINQIWKVN
jgi:hypothetical protein